ncbi:Methionine gamma-lyase [Halobacillus karajensis]|uniref:L-methionine gamma-lyase n=1 Tax=Halobacillus karajensis TaxID=195088 RepID=A0A024P483_9BACI|nr:Methionine gamma-lyase [Halobacillus karajensis]CDQ23213.1 Methionine gamma-lyase [Halobacillus karajensis]CDQ26695.1 Methionine gamma-lyase [Halobacillus karajensis]
MATPIFQTSTFSFGTAAEGARRFAGEEEGYIYTRLGNPTVRALEDRIAVLEGGERGLAFASGMAAVSAVLIALTKTGDHVLCSNGLYGCTYGLLQMFEEKYKITHDFSFMATEEDVRNGITEKTRCIFIETPINPTMKMIDLSMVARVAKEYGIPVVVDNTFCTPYLQRPLDLGCDIVLHSATKYIGGHGDVIAGLVVGEKAFMDDLAMSQQKDIGGILSPFDAWLLLRGLKTLHVRMDRHSSNADEIARKLKEHPKIKHIYYPGMKEHEHHSIVRKQMRTGGGVLAFELEGSKEEAQQFMDRLRLIQIAVSLGDAETLIQHPATMTHAVVPEEKRREMGIGDSLIRLSVGLEALDDIWGDLVYALNEV